MEQQSPDLILNDKQHKSSLSLTKYILSDRTNFLLLGPAGSGKTTVITNAFNKSKLRVAFCAFTNKATSILRNISNKFKIEFHANFLTIHKLLHLEPYYLHTEHQVKYKFNKEKITGMHNYDVIIFDECSNISSDLYKYLVEAKEYIKFKHGHNIKYVFLGDYWQLPPVEDENSQVFTASTEEKWSVCKLEEIMRANNDMILRLNKDMISWTHAFKTKDLCKLNSFIKQYPFNLARDKSNYISHLDTYLDRYIEVWKRTPDVVMLTYSRANCNKTNFAIQDRIDINNNRTLPEKREDQIWFYAGDRCCVDKPIDVLTIKECEISCENHPFISTENVICSALDQYTGHTLYNGEIFDVIRCKDANIYTPLNKYSYNPAYFTGQILTVRRVGDDIDHDILYIPDKQLNQARVLLRNNTSRMFYLEMMSNFIKFYPKLDYGYCITVYKSQGSEWEHVLINLNSIKWCMVGPDIQAHIKKKLGLFRASYTALSRASKEITLFWS